jgi:hypothetical protein
MVPFGNAVLVVARRTIMNVLRIFLALSFVCIASMVFADDEKPPKEHPKDVREEINKTAKTTGKKAKKDFKNVRKQVNKPWKKVTEDGSEKTKD